ncbi:MAG: bifunctional nuclease family protein [Candidatus Handelsmanbacteria bacterium]|nr:bifunctional nuclease family protein [Candidatus Handelsmanbacteria bacterium]
MKPGGQRLIPVQIISVYPSSVVSASPEGFHALLKGEDEKVVRIIIGEFEGKALDMALQRQSFPRPLTHNLIQNLLEKVKGRVEQVVIHTLKEETFLAYLFIQIGPECFYLDCRPSDGMILATLMGVPILMSQEVLEEAGQEASGLYGKIDAEVAALVAGEAMDAEQLLAMEAKASEPPGESSELDKLKAQLDRLVAEEAYEEAAKLRDQISRMAAGQEGRGQ